MSESTLLLELEATREELRREREELDRERALRLEKEAQVESLLAENRELRARVDWFARRMFGKSSEKCDPGQILLAFEAAQQEAVQADRLETAAGEETPATPRRRSPRPSSQWSACRARCRGTSTSGCRCCGASRWGRSAASSCS